MKWQEMVGFYLKHGECKRIRSVYNDSGVSVLITEQKDLAFIEWEEQIWRGKTGDAWSHEPNAKYSGIISQLASNW